MARGGQELRAAAMSALEQNRPWDALLAANSLVEILPDSSQGWLMLADAAEALQLAEEALQAHRRLAALIPYRADIWLRLAFAEARAERAGGESATQVAGAGAYARYLAALERADAAGKPEYAADQARCALADFDRARGDVERAERWLERCSSSLKAGSEWVIRRAALWLDQGRTEQAAALVEGMPEPQIADGLSWLTLGRLWFELGKLEEAHRALERGLVLETPGSGPIVAGYIARSKDERFINNIREVTECFGWEQHAGWRAAFAEAEGRGQEALQALEQLEPNELEPAWLLRYLELAERTRNIPAFKRAYVALSASARPVSANSAALASCLAAFEQRPEAWIQQLESLLASPDWRKSEWITELVETRWAALLALQRPAQDAGARVAAAENRPAWSPLLDWLGRISGEQHHHALQRAISALSLELSRPLKLAVVGEFNAGKSSFINAWLGEEIASVGVVPTTAKSHHLAWAADEYVSIEYISGEKRVLPYRTIDTALASAPQVSRVHIYSPIDSLKRIEVIDTPGFNSVNDAHTQEAGRLLTEAHVALWLVDASQALKATELQRLEWLGSLGLAVVVVVNKLDRLREAPRLEVLNYVQRSITQAKVRLFVPVIGVSARLAQDPQTRSDSGWDAVEALFNELLGRADEIRERALLSRLSRALSSVAEEPLSGGPAIPEARSLLQQFSEQYLSAGFGRRLLTPLIAALAEDLRPLRRGSLSIEAQHYGAGRAQARMQALAREDLHQFGAKFCEGLAAPQVVKKIPEEFISLAEEQLAPVLGAWAVGAWAALFELASPEHANLGERHGRIQQAPGGARGASELVDMELLGHQIEELSRGCLQRAQELSEVDEPREHRILSSLATFLKTNL